MDDFDRINFIRALVAKRFPDIALNIHMGWADNHPEIQRMAAQGVSQADLFIYKLLTMWTNVLSTDLAISGEGESAVKIARRMDARRIGGYVGFIRGKTTVFKDGSKIIVADNSVEFVKPVTGKRKHKRASTQQPIVWTGEREL